jgi:adenylosuccinate lyase
METWEQGGSFRDRLAARPEVARTLPPTKLDLLFDPAYYLRNLDRIYARTLAHAWEESDVRTPPVSCA